MFITTKFHNNYNVIIKNVISAMLCKYNRRPNECYFLPAYGKYIHIYEKKIIFIFCVYLHIGRERFFSLLLSSHLFLSTFARFVCVRLSNATPAFPFPTYFRLFFWGFGFDSYAENKIKHELNIEMV